MSQTSKLDPSSDDPVNRISKLLNRSPVQDRQAPRRVLNTGSGVFMADKLHAAFRTGDWEEVRLDIDPRVKPDLVGSITDMRTLVPDESFDAVWSSHNLEHLHPHEVMPALCEFRRVLKRGGFALVTCPNLEAVTRLVADGYGKTVAYQSPAGPITPLDMLFGHAASIAAGNDFMSHHTGFTADSIGELAVEAGFGEVRVGTGRFFDLWAVFLMPEVSIEDVRPWLDDTEQSDLLD